MGSFLHQKKDFYLNSLFLEVFLKVNNFAAIVTMDAHGNSLHRDVEATTGEALAKLRHA